MGETLKKKIQHFNFIKNMWTDSAVNMNNILYQQLAHEWVSIPFGVRENKFDNREFSRVSYSLQAFWIFHHSIHSFKKKSGNVFKIQNQGEIYGERWKSVKSLFHKKERKPKMRSKSITFFI